MRIALEYGNQYGKYWSLSRIGRLRRRLALLRSRQVVLQNLEYVSEITTLEIWRSSMAASASAARSSAAARRSYTVLGNALEPGTCTMCRAPRPRRQTVLQAEGSILLLMTFDESRRHCKVQRS